MNDSSIENKQRAGSVLLALACMYLCRFGWEHWPEATGVIAYIVMVICAIWYLWKYFVIPFREGLREDDHP